MNIANGFGALGYLACAIQWLWGIILYSSTLQSYLTSVTPKVEQPIVHTSPVIVDGGTNTILLIFGAIITIVIIALSVYFIIKTPSAIVKTTKKAVHDTAETISPAILRIEGKKDTIFNRRKLELNIKLILKTLLILVPFIASVMSMRLPHPLFSGVVIMYSSGILLLVTLLLFAIQHILASVLKVHKKNIW